MVKHKRLRLLAKTTILFCVCFMKSKSETDFVKLRVMACFHTPNPRSLAKDALTYLNPSLTDRFAMRVFFENKAC